VEVQKVRTSITSHYFTPWGSYNSTCYYEGQSTVLHYPEYVKIIAEHPLVTTFIAGKIIKCDLFGVRGISSDVIRWWLGSLWYWTIRLTSVTFVENIMLMTSVVHLILMTKVIISNSSSNTGGSIR
jgi:hypothetical protein